MVFSIIKPLLLFRAAICGCLLGIFAGCSTPQCRAQQQAAAFHQLSPADQKLVMHGHIRQGMSRDAVYVAWGNPDRKTVGGKGRESFERWIYFSQLTSYAPMGSYDQRYLGAADLYAANFSLWSRPGFGYGGAGDVGFLYPSRVILTEARYKNVEFIDGKVHAFALQRGGTSLLPGTP